MQVEQWLKTQYWLWNDIAENQNSIQNACNQQVKLHCSQITVIKHHNITVKSVQASNSSFISLFIFTQSQFFSLFLSSSLSWDEISDISSQATHRRRANYVTVTQMHQKIIKHLFMLMHLRLFLLLYHLHIIFKLLSLFLSFIFQLLKSILWQVLVICNSQ